MNELKKALIDVAGDMSASESAVKNAVLYKKRRRKGREIFIIPAFVMVLCFIGFTLWLLPNQADDRQADSLFNNDYLYDYFIGRQKMFTPDLEVSQSEKDAAFSYYAEIIGVEQLAESHHLQISEAEYEKQKKLSDNVVNEEVRQQLLSLANLSIAQYEKYVQPQLIRHTIYLDKLNAIWLEQNPRMLSEFATGYTYQLAHKYLLEHFEEEYFALQKRHETASNHSIGVPKSGVIAAIEGNMLFFIQNMTREELQYISDEEKFRPEDGKIKAWIVNIDEIPVAVGDYVKVSISGTYRNDSSSYANALSEGLEVMLPAAHTDAIQSIDVAGSDVAQWLELIKDVSWESQEVVNNFSKPLYIVNVENQKYTIFKNDYKNYLIVPYGESKIAKLTQGRTEKVEAFLQQFVTK
ncbi:hypothetical protein ACTHOQ_15700 [Solibacillus silvestris]|uniref:hypothetical protein n=1 Tax=Solibacillus silvestris TaxID=76853 RepID=UPI003F7DD4EC